MLYNKIGDKMKKRLWMLIPVVALFISVIATIILLPKSKLKGGYGDELRTNKLVTRIVSTNLSKGEEKNYIEVITSVENTSNQSFIISDQDFFLNHQSPSNRFNLELHPKENIHVRQVFNFEGPVSSYLIKIDSNTLEFDFTLKNNHLIQQNLKLKETVSTNIEKDYTEIMNQKEEERQKIVAERESNAKKIEEEAKLQREKLNNELADKEELAKYYGYYLVAEKNNYSAVSLEKDGTAKIIVACENERDELKIEGLVKTKINDKYTFSGEYQSSTGINGTAVFTLQGGQINVLDAPYACLIRKLYKKKT